MDGELLAGMLVEGEIGGCIKLKLRCMSVVRCFNMFVCVERVTWWTNRAVERWCVGRQGVLVSVRVVL